jgi:hypothetical protein
MPVYVHAELIQQKQNTARNARHVRLNVCPQASAGMQAIKMEIPK